MTNPPPPGPGPAPRAFLRQKPAKVIRTRSRTAKVTFRFGSDQAGASFACRIDGGLFRSCGERLVRRFGLGPHSLRVVARVEGAEEGSAATYRFRVKRIS